MSIFLLFLLLALLPSSSYAYLDPGAGSLLIQVLLGGVAGLVVIGKLYWSKIKSLFGFKEKADNTDSKN